jgi:hypothetical protein
MLPYRVTSNPASLDTSPNDIPYADYDAQATAVSPQTMRPTSSLSSATPAFSPPQLPYDFTLKVETANITANVLPHQKNELVGDFISLLDYFKGWLSKHEEPNNPYQLCN